MTRVVVGADDLTFADVEAVARGGATVELAAEAVGRMARSRAHVEAAARGGRPVYGINTGFGALAGTRIPTGARLLVQQALLRSHAAGMGPPIAREVVRGMLLLRAAALARGYSGVRPLVVQRLLDRSRSGELRRSGHGAVVATAGRHAPGGVRYPHRFGADRSTWACTGRWTLPPARSSGWVLVAWPPAPCRGGRGYSASPAACCRHGCWHGPEQPGSAGASGAATDAPRSGLNQHP